MRGALQATLAAFRAYRRSSESRRQAAADATWARLAKRNWTDARVRANTDPDPAEQAGGASKSRVRRSLIAFGAPIALVATGIIAIFLGISELNQRGQQPGMPYSTVDPRASAPGTSVDAAPAAGGSIAPSTSVTPLPGAGVLKTSATSAAGLLVVTGPASAGATSARPVTPVASPTTATPTASASAGVLDLCREVVAAGNGWPSVLKGTDRATVIAAAGSKKNVLSYCTNLVNNS